MVNNNRMFGKSSKKAIQLENAGLHAIKQHGKGKYIEQKGTYASPCQFRMRSPQKVIQQVANIFHFSMCKAAGCDKLCGAIELLRYPVRNRQLIKTRHCGGTKSYPHRVAEPSSQQIVNL
jgi:hypothetical protein